MTAWESTTLRKVYSDGFPVKATVYVAADISANDTVDASADFTEVLAASLTVIRNGVAVGCPIVSDTTVTVPLLGASNLFHDAGWLLVMGTART